MGRWKDHRRQCRKIQPLVAFLPPAQCVGVTESTKYIIEPRMPGIHWHYSVSLWAISGVWAVDMTERRTLPRNSLMRDLDAHSLIEMCLSGTGATRSVLQGGIGMSILRTTFRRVTCIDSLRGGYLERSVSIVDTMQILEV